MSNIIYNKTIWENSPSETTPLNATNLNKIENGIEAVTEYVDENIYTKETVDHELSNKVDKIEGKGLSTEDYTSDEKAQVSTIANKVDKIEGKGLSTNDYTSAEKESVATIYNKVDKVAGKELSTNDFTNEYKNKVEEAYTTTSKILYVKMRGYIKDYNNVNMLCLCTLGGEDVENVHDYTQITIVPDTSEGVKFYDTNRIVFEQGSDVKTDLNKWYHIGFHNTVKDTISSSDKVRRFYNNKLYSFSVDPNSNILYTSVTTEDNPEAYVTDQFSIMNTDMPISGNQLIKFFPFKLGVDENGNYGYYKAGADTVTPFKTGSGDGGNLLLASGYNLFKDGWMNLNYQALDNSKIEFIAEEENYIEFKFKESGRYYLLYKINGYGTLKTYIGGSSYGQININYFGSGKSDYMVFDFIKDQTIKFVLTSTNNITLDVFIFNGDGLSIYVPEGEG